MKNLGDICKGSQDYERESDKCAYLHVVYCFSLTSNVCLQVVVHNNKEYYHKMK